MTEVVVTYALIGLAFATLSQKVAIDELERNRAQMRTSIGPVGSMMVELSAWSLFVVLWPLIMLINIMRLVAR